MDKLQKQIDELKIQIDELNNKSENLLNESETSSSTTYSNLEVKNSPVKFRFPSIFPKDNTPIVGSTGRIEIRLADDTKEYIPYYDSGATNTIQQYTTSISHANSGGGTASYTDTITSTFKPHTVVFFGEYHQGSNVSMSNGQAGITAPTTGVSSWMKFAGGVYGSGVNSNRIGWSDIGDTYVSDWNDDGVVLTTSLTGSNGSSATVNAQIILIG